MKRVQSPAELKQALAAEAMRRVREAAQEIKKVTERYGVLLTAVPVVLPDGRLGANVQLQPKEEP